MIVKLTSDHALKIKQLFYKSPNYMGVSIKDQFNLDIDITFEEKLYEIFCDTYLSDLEAFHAYGYVNQETGMVDALISYYESDTDPSWYFTIYRSTGNNSLLKDILDTVLQVNESNGRFKFFSLVSSKHARLLRKFLWSSYSSERYEWVDECVIPANTKPFFSHHWEMLFKRTLLPIDTTVRCTFLKQQHRNILPKFGAI